MCDNDIIALLKLIDQEYKKVRSFLEQWCIKRRRYKNDIIVFDNLFGGLKGWVKKRHKNRYLHPAKILNYSASIRKTTITQKEKNKISKAIGNLNEILYGDSDRYYKNGGINCQVAFEIESAGHDGKYRLKAVVNGKDFADMVDQFNKSKDKNDQTEKGSQKPFGKELLLKFLKDIEKHIKFELNRRTLFPIQWDIPLKGQFIPIYASLENKDPKKKSSNWGYVDEKQRIESAYSFKEYSPDLTLSIIPWSAIKKKDKRIIILADTGMGKTTLLLWEAYICATEAINDLLANKKPFDDAVVPIFLSLTDLTKGNSEIPESILNILKRNYPESFVNIKHFIKEKINTGKCLLLFDSLDTVPLERRNILADNLFIFLKNFSGQIIFTSRPVAYTPGFIFDAKEIGIVPFNTGQIRSYAHNWFNNIDVSSESGSKLAQNFVSRLNKNSHIKGMARNPLILSMLCKLYIREEDELPDKRGILYKSIINNMLSRSTRFRSTKPLGRDSAKNIVIRDIAYRFSCKKQGEFKEEELLRAIIECLQNDYLNIEFKKDIPSELLHELSEEDGIFIKDQFSDGEKYLFFHRTFQEYLTAAYINDEISKDRTNGLKTVKGLLWDFDWHEIIVLLSGLMEEPIHLISAIYDEDDDIFSNLLVLAGRCVAECGEESDPLSKEITGKLSELWQAYPGLNYIKSCVTVLGYRCTDIIEMLSDCIQKANVIDKNQVAQLLVKIGTDKATEVFIRLLKTKEKSVSSYVVVKCLTQIGSAQATNALLSFFEEDKQIRNLVLMVFEDFDSHLGKMLIRKSIDLFNQSLEDEKYSKYVDILGFLWWIKSPQIMRIYIKTLKDWIKFNKKNKIDIFAMGIGDLLLENFTGFLCGLNPDVIREFYFRLAAIDESEFAKRLLISLEEWFSHTSGDWVETIIPGSVKDYIEIFIQDLSDEDKDIRALAAWSLSKIKSHRSINALIEALKDKDFDVKKIAAISLAKIGNPQATSALSQVFRDNVAKKKVFYVLEGIGDKKAVDVLCQHLHLIMDDVVLQLLKIGNDQTKTTLVRALIANGYLFFQEKEETIEETIHNWNNDIIRVFLHILEYGDNDAKSNVVKVLRMIDSPEVVEMLIYTLNKSREEGIGGDFAFLNLSEALGIIGGAKVTTALIQTLKDKKSYCRVSAAKALGYVDSAEAIKALKRALYYKSSSIRSQAASSLGKIGGLNSINPLIKLLKDEDEGVRSAATQALKTIGSIKILKKIIRDPEIDIYQPEIFSLARDQAVKYRNTETNMIPVYPEMVKKYKRNSLLRNPLLQ